MEKLLNAIAERLRIRVTDKQSSETYLDGIIDVSISMYKYESVPYEIREAFKQQFILHLTEKLLETEFGKSVEYIFDFGDERPIGTLMEDANNNMAEVFLKLPSLKDGDTYSLPYDTFLSFVLTSKDDKVIVNTDASYWIKEAYGKQ